MARILFVGIASVDIVNIVADYPREDEKIRAISQLVRRGGNAANSAVVMAQLGHESHWIGMLAQDAQVNIILDDFARFGVQHTHAVNMCSSHTPTSYITLAQKTGSRTIVHYRNLRELLASDFSSVDVEQYDWIHFEGRNVSESYAMLREIRQRMGSNFPISVELEKGRDNLESLLTFATLAFVSKEYWQSQAAQSVEFYLAALHQQYPHLDLISPMGAQGAWMLYQQEKQARFVPTPHQIQVVDSVGAGDTFNAAIICALLNQQSLEEAVLFAHGVAAKKCQRFGFDLS